MTNQESKKVFYSFTGTEVVIYTALAFILGSVFMFAVIREVAEFTIEKKILEKQATEQVKMRGE
jgi:cell division protein FtsL